MDPLVLSDGENTFRMQLLRWDGDAYISVSVDSNGFAGRNDLHILGDEFKMFCANLLAVQQSLKGECHISSISPNELDVKIRPADSLGHFEVLGETGYHVISDHQAYWHSVSFGFQIEPSQLDRAIRVPWVVEYGKKNSCD